MNVSSPVSAFEKNDKCAWDILIWQEMNKLYMFVKQELGVV